MVPFQRRAGLRHLHQGDTPLLHSGAAGAGKDDHWKFFFGCPLYHPCDLLTHHMTHAAHHKSGITDTDGRFLPLDLTASGDNGLI